MSALLPERVDPAQLRRRHIRRRVVVSGALVWLLLAAFAVALTLGDVHLSLGQIVNGLAGRGDRLADLVLHRLRLPRALCAILVGAALAVSGSICQSLARNPLATPDILGVNLGASSAVCVGILSFGLTGPGVVVAALVGALAAGGLLYGLAWKDGIQGARLILIGIGLAAAGGAALSYVLTTKPALETQRALFWLVGSLNEASWEQVRIGLVALAVLLVSAPWCMRYLAGLELGDEVAAALGVPVTRARAVVLTIAVVLAALAVSVAGPLAFVGLVAAPIARRLTGTAGYAHLSAASIGALVVLAADNIGAHALGPIPVPAGVVTSVVGAPYLLFLLTRSAGRTGTRS